MDKKVCLTWELLSAWSGVAFVITFVITFGLLGHTLPRPFPPAANAQELAELYVKHLSDLRLGWTLSLVLISLYMPWSAQISMHMKAIEKHSRVLTWTQLISGALTVFVVSWGMLCWGTATYRPDRAPEITQTLNDIGWLSLETQWMITTVQMCAVAIVGLYDKRPDPTFPKWVCWLSIFCGWTFAPASLTFYYKSGPFAWDGLLGFYVPYAAWLVWALVLSYYMIKDVKRRMAEPEKVAQTAIA
jgi:hypothetical protein